MIISTHRYSNASFRGVPPRLSSVVVVPILYRIGYNFVQRLPCSARLGNCSLGCEPARREPCQRHNRDFKGCSPNVTICFAQLLSEQEKNRTTNRAFASIVDVQLKCRKERARKPVTPVEKGGKAWRTGMKTTGELGANWGY